MKARTALLTIGAGLTVGDLENQSRQDKLMPKIKIFITFTGGV